MVQLTNKSLLNDEVFSFNKSANLTSVSDMPTAGYPGSKNTNKKKEKTTAVVISVFTIHRCPLRIIV